MGLPGATQSQDETACKVLTGLGLALVLGYHNEGYRTLHLYVLTGHTVTHEYQNEMTGD